MSGRRTRALLGSAAVLLGAGCGAPPAVVTGGEPGIALSFDDQHILDWAAALPHFHGHPATLFVSHTDHFSDADWADLHRLADAGFEIAAHTVHHEFIDSFCGSRSDCPPDRVQAYLDQEVRPELAAFAAHGFLPTAFAFPGGQTVPEMTTALLGEFDVLRGITVEPDADIPRDDAPYLGCDGRRVIGGIEMDARAGHGVDALDTGLARAEARRETLVLYGHDLVDTEGSDTLVTTLAKLDAIIARAEARGLEFQRISDLCPFDRP